MRAILAVVTFLSWQAVTNLASSADPILIEAESFSNHGGWKLDTQFIEIMGSPYLMAHGLGRPVENASTTVTIPEAGAWHLWVRTKDWVAPWGAEGSPGKFQLLGFLAAVASICTLLATQTGSMAEQRLDAAEEVEDIIGEVSTEIRAHPDREQELLIRLGTVLGKFE